MKANWLRRLAIAAAIVGLGSAVHAGEFANRRLARNYAWHHNYYDPAWGPEPHALVVPPNVRGHVEYNWGVAGTEFRGIPHQYERGIRIVGSAGGGPFSPAPIQPSSTNQMGVYYIRGPW